MTGVPAADEADAAGPSLASLLRLDPDAIATPWDAYAELRGRGVWWCPEWEAWLVSRFHDVRDVAGGPRTFSSAAPMGPGPEMAAASIRAALAGTAPDRAARVEDFLRERGRRLFMADGARHRADRERLAHVFTRRRMDALAEPLAAICAGLVEQLDVDGPVDLVGQYANLVAARGLGRVLGVTGGRGQGDADFVAWAAGINAALGPIPDAQLPGVAAAIDDYLAFFTAEVEARRAAPGDDLLSAIVTGVDETDGTPFTTQQVLGVLGQFVAAGIATTASAIAATMNVLANRPDLADAARADPDLLGRLIIEVLRLESPVQALYRTATVDAGVSGAHVASGDRVMVMFGAGNRDPHAFDDPDSLNLDRPTASTHLAFGYGPHYCIGAPLGLREITTAVGTLLHRYTTITPAGEPAASIAAAPILRGLETLPVTLT